MFIKLLYKDCLLDCNILYLFFFDCMFYYNYNYNNILFIFTYIITLLI